MTSAPIGATAPCTPHPLLWRFHAIHHSAEHLDWLVNTRAHPFDMVFTRLSGLAPVYLLGLAHTTGPHIDPAVAIVTIFGTLWTFFIHANIRVRLGPLELADFLPCLSPLASYERRASRPQFCLRFPAHRPVVRHRLAARSTGPPSMASAPKSRRPLRASFSTHSIPPANRPVARPSPILLI